MDYQLIVLVIGVFSAFFVLTRIIRVASEHERFAVIDLGRFKDLKGPGVLFKLDRNTEWLRVKLGDRGKLLAPGVARVGGSDLPVRADGSVSAQQFVRLTGFEGEASASRLVVTVDPDQRPDLQCPKCGHVMDLE